MSDLSTFYSEQHLDTSDGFGSTLNRANAHRGFDVLRHALGTPVPALYAGVVTFAGWYSGILGNVVSVRLSDGTTISYCHLSAVWVNVGQTIAQSDDVGTLGDTGRVTGPHTHVAVNPPGSNGDPGTGLVVDPLPYIRAARDGDAGPAAGEPTGAAGGTSISDVIWSGADWSYAEPIGAIAAQIQADASALGFYNFDDGSARPADGRWGEYTRKGVQMILCDSGTFCGEIDGEIWRGGCYGIQQFADSRGGYTAKGGIVDGAPRGLSWACFAEALSAYRAEKQAPTAAPAPAPTPEPAPASAPTVTEPITEPAPVETVVEPPVESAASEPAPVDVIVPEPVEAAPAVTAEPIHTVSELLPTADKANELVGQFFDAVQSGITDAEEAQATKLRFFSLSFFRLLMAQFFPSENKLRATVAAVRTFWQSARWASVAALIGNIGLARTTGQDYDWWWLGYSALAAVLVAGGAAWTAFLATSVHGSPKAYKA